jgi:hypothetical protein
MKPLLPYGFAAPGSAVVSVSGENALIISKKPAAPGRWPAAGSVRGPGGWHARCWCRIRRLQRNDGRGRLRAGPRDAIGSGIARTGSKERQQAKCKRGAHPRMLRPFGHICLFGPVVVPATGLSQTLPGYLVQAVQNDISMTGTVRLIKSVVKTMVYSAVTMRSSALPPASPATPPVPPDPRSSGAPPRPRHPRSCGCWRAGSCRTGSWATARQPAHP